MDISRLPRVELPLALDTVVTDGKVAATVIGLDEAGRYQLEDLHTELIYDPATNRTHVETITYPVQPAVLLRDWRVVRIAPAPQEPTVAA